MIFPDYELARYQLRSAAATRYIMGASAPEPLELRELLAHATEDELKQWRDFPLNYSPNQGDVSLRERICAAYRGLGTENILVTAGAQEAIFIAYHALLAAGDRVQVITPAFEPLVIVPQAIGADIERVPMQLGKDAWRFDLGQWFERLTDDTRVATVNFPHNPTGQTVSKADFAEIVAACSRQGCWLLSDEVFRGMEHDPAVRLPEAVSEYERGISLGVISKPFGLGGVRVGWIACRDTKLLQRMLQIKLFLSVCNGRADELLAGIALNHREELLQAHRQRIAANLTLIRNNLDRLSPRIQWYAPRAGCIAYPGLTGQMSALEFARRLLNETGVNIVPGSCFLQGPSHFRIGFGRDDFSRAFQFLLDWLD